jgi:hypothetical protein
MSGNMLVIDGKRSAPLYDDGLPDYLAATLVDRDGETHYALVKCNALGDHSVQLCPADARVGHEQPGAPLPIEIVRRLAIASRKHLDGTPEE